MDFAAAAAYMDNNYSWVLVLMFFAATVFAFKGFKMGVNVLRDPHEHFLSKAIVAVILIPVSIWLLFVGSLLLVFFLAMALVIGEKISDFLKRI